ncbi:Crp/Fnr family transcriptional regulator [Carboxydothermus pertinax]|uniref:Crp/Fnr family transcriptional regulator n=1 Tax=Carboxydothermus pertinax TaxID=870242 RepID=A0A1L8CSB5_9THEO|nr:Crp/Fnr family transcriptional regulator [Carboxydothermus pertinax]GAV21709.1 Crp/Fnr family transcriptional regulator [Carboxydothermus pertinax]
MENWEVLKKIPLFGELSTEELKEIGNLLYARRLKKGQILFSEGDPGTAVYFLKSGRIKLYKEDREGREHILHYVEPGDIFAEVVLFSKRPYPATAEVLEPAEVLVIPNPEMESLLKRRGEIAVNLIKVLLYRLDLANQKIKELALKDSLARVCSVLLRYGPVINLSQQEIASLAGVSRETASRIINEFKRIGVIRAEGRSIEIINYDRLKDFS